MPIVGAGVALLLTEPDRGSHHSEDQSVFARFVPAEGIIRCELDSIVGRIKHFDFFGIRIKGADTVDEGLPFRSIEAALCEYDSVYEEMRRWLGCVIF